MDIVSNTCRATACSIFANLKPNWMRLLSEIPCLIASNIGDVIVGDRSPFPDSQCNSLIPGRNYLAATTDLSEMARRESQDLTAASCHLPVGYWTATSTAGSVDYCQRTDKSEDCWKEPTFLQSIDKKTKYHPQDVVQRPENGVVVFGSMGKTGFAPRPLPPCIFI